MEEIFNEISNYFTENNLWSNREAMSDYLNGQVGYRKYERFALHIDNNSPHAMVDYMLSNYKPVETPSIRTFDTGANRNSDEGKLDYEGFLSPTVIEAYADYMHKNRFLEDGSMRDSDNWQKGIPQDAYMKSMYRHFMDVWKDHRGIETHEDEITNLCALLFNVSGMLHEKLKNIEVSAREKS